MKLQYHILCILFGLAFILNTSPSIAQCSQSNDFLQNHYDSTQADFSKELYNPTSDGFKNQRNVINKIINYNCSRVWVDNDGQEGIIGLNYQRLEVKVLTADEDTKDASLYHITGKTKFKDTLASFSGTIKIIAAYMDNSDPTEIDSNTHGTIYAQYNFQQDNKVYNTGTLQGIENTDFIINTATQQVVPDTIIMGDDDYTQDTFVGTWKKYNSLTKLKCVFAIGRLPFTFDFDKGEGDMVPNDRYRKNGWQGYPDDTWVNTPTGTIPNKWWDKK